jgi:hypothetical protein
MQAISIKFSQMMFFDKDKTNFKRTDTKNWKKRKENIRDYIKDK